VGIGLRHLKLQLDNERSNLWKQITNARSPILHDLLITKSSNIATSNTQDALSTLKFTSTAYTKIHLYICYIQVYTYTSMYLCMFAQ
jgi:hypothetical protein